MTLFALRKSSLKATFRKCFIRKLASFCGTPPNVSASNGDLL